MSLYTLAPFTGVLLVISSGLLLLSCSYLVYRKSPNTGFTIICLLLSFLFYFQYRDELDEVFSAPTNLHTFSSVSEELQWPARLSLVVAGNEEFIELIVSPGKIPSLIRLTTLRSGMPAYVFNLQGLFIDSTLDHHDDTRYQDRWGRVTKQQITKAEALEITDKKL